jgi:hypothetical protein
MAKVERFRRTLEKKLKTDLSQPKPATMSKIVCLSAAWVQKAKEVASCISQNIQDIIQMEHEGSVTVA